MLVSSVSSLKGPNRGYASGTQVGSRADCLESYAPCSCSLLESGGISIRCDNLSPEGLRAVLNRTYLLETFYSELDWTLSFPTVAGEPIQIPSDILAGKQFRDFLIVRCFFTNHKVQISPDAFASTRNASEFFGLYDCDLASQNDFEFLANFERLNRIYLVNLRNMESIQSLPSLPTITTLILDRSTGLSNLLGFPASSLPSLQSLEISSCQLSDDTAELILSGIASRPTRTVLKILRLSSNSLTRIPPSLASFSSLHTVELDSNRLLEQNITQASLPTPGGPLDKIYFSFDATGIHSVEAGAFDLCK